MTTIKDPGPKLSEAEVSNLETRLGVDLPEQYRHFLLKYNGGRPSPDIVDIEGLPGGGSDVQVFFGIGTSPEADCIEWNLEILSERLERLEPGWLPIACDSGGSDYFLRLTGPERGAVVYCDLQSVAFDYEAVPDLYPVAPDFEAFLAKLRPFEESE